MKHALAGMLLALLCFAAGSQALAQTLSLTLTADKTVVREGERVTFTARAQTTSESPIPLNLDLWLPEGLQALSSTSVTAPLSATHPRVMRVHAIAVTRGAYTVTASLRGRGVQASTRLRVRKPPTITLDVHAATDTITVGQHLAFVVKIGNHGDEVAPHVELRVPAPNGMQTTGLQQTLTLPAGETRVYTLEGFVRQDAPPQIVATAHAVFQNADTLRTAAVRILRPQVQLEREIQPRVALPGERVQVRLRVTNTGQAPLRYQLTDTTPEWLEPGGPQQFTGRLAPGEQQVHTYHSTVRFGANAVGRFTAHLESNAGPRQNQAILERRLAAITITPDPQGARVGQPARLTINISNPLGRPTTLQLQASPDAALTASQLPATLRLAASETRELPVDLMPTRTGALRYEIVAFHNNRPASYPTHADLSVKQALVPERISVLRFPFDIQTPAGDQLLFRHLLPPNAHYQPGSATFQGRPLQEPLVRTQGNRSFLYWLLPFTRSGELQYAVRHHDPLPEVHEPSLTLILGTHDIPLVGQATTAELTNAKPLPVVTHGMLLAPPAGTVLRQSDDIHIIVQAPHPGRVELLLNDHTVARQHLGKASYDPKSGTQHLEYYGVQLKPGRNQIVVVTDQAREERTVWLAGTPTRLQFHPASLVADGATPVTVDVVALDDQQLPNGFGAVTIHVNAEPVTADAFPNQPGYQLLMRDGRATLTLRPFTGPTQLTIQASFNELVAQEELHVGGLDAFLAQAQASATVRLGRNGPSVQGVARAYLETPLGNGTIQAALDTQQPLTQPTLDLDRFPVTGATGEARPALQSTDGIAVRYDDDHLSVGYYHDTLAVPGLKESLDATALRASFRTNLSPTESLTTRGVLALVPAERVTEDITPDGTRLYHLKHAVQPGSERVQRIEGQGLDLHEVTLRRSLDYVIDYEHGTLVLASAMWPKTPDFQTVRLHVAYAPANSPRTQLTGGAGVRYRNENGLHVEVGAAYREGVRLGALAGYETPSASVDVDYHFDTAQDSNQLGVSAQLDNPTLGMGFGVRYDLTTADLSGHAQASLQLLPDTRLVLTHQRSHDENQTRLQIEHTIASLQLSVGAEYDWLARATRALAGVTWSSGAVSTKLAHAQSLQAGTPSVTDFRMSYNLLDSLRLESGLQYVGGSGITGTFGLVQDVGAGNLSVSYQLPGASGDGNRARFAIDTPLALDEHWSADLSAGYQHALQGGDDEAASSLGLRYHDDHLIATLASDLSLRNHKPKVVLRGGASGRVDAHTTISLDATYQLLPEPTGRFTIAYATRDDVHTLLGYHRLTTGPTAMLEGEVAPTYHPDPAWQARWAFAYRFPLAHPERSALQVTLGGTGYPLPWLGLGGAVHHLAQPALQASHTAFSAEASFKLAPDAWLAVGYTLSGFEGLTLDTRGIYLRLDAAGGRQP